MFLSHDVAYFQCDITTRIMNILILDLCNINRILHGCE